MVVAGLAHEQVDGLSGGTPAWRFLDKMWELFEGRNQLQSYLVYGYRVFSLGVHCGKSVQVKAGKVIAGGLDHIGRTLIAQGGMADAGRGQVCAQDFDAIRLGLRWHVVAWGQ